MTTRSQDERLLDDHFFMAAQRWLHRLEISSLTLVCHHEGATPLGTRNRPALQSPGCLQDMPLHRLLDLWVTGVRDVAVAPSSCCDERELRDLAGRWGTFAGERLIIAMTSATPSGNWTWSLAPNRVPVDRRGLLGLSRRSQPLWPTHDATADDHERLRTSMRAAGVSSVEAVPPGLSLLASGCTACGVCVAACPHDALTLATEGDETSLVHAPGACRGEQQCVALCPVDALTVSGPLPWMDVLADTPRVLATLQVAVCERCRARFPASSGSRWCETCRIRRSDPFGSHLPAAALRILRARGHDRP